MEQHNPFQEGKILLVDKPLDVTSFFAVKRIRGAIRRAFNVRKIKVGHAGTLDPKATGLLIICTGKQTKSIHLYQGQEKEYTGTIRLGEATPSSDTETEVNETAPTDHITSELMDRVRREFIGEIVQSPPLFSAIRIDGERAYEKARRGEDVEVKKRVVTVTDFDIDSTDFPDVHFRIRCSKGTYIRSIARDFGLALDSVGYLTALRRTKIGDFDVENALSIEDTIEMIDRTASE
jgi:tRNA pseudouridine55 synthase